MIKDQKCGCRRSSHGPQNGVSLAAQTAVPVFNCVGLGLSVFSIEARTTSTVCSPRAVILELQDPLKCLNCPNTKERDITEPSYQFTINFGKLSRRHTILRTQKPSHLINQNVWRQQHVAVLPPCSSHDKNTTSTELEYIRREGVKYRVWDIAGQTTAMAAVNTIIQSMDYVAEDGDEDSSVHVDG